MEDNAQCLKITEKASYDYIFNGPKLFKNAKNSQFENLKLGVKKCYQTGQLL